jgi:hypothetical protein
MKTPPATVELCCARLPRTALAYMAAYRTRAGLCVCIDGEAVWVYWDAADDEVLHRVLALHGAQVFQRRDGQWYAPGHSLPHFGVPDPSEARPLISALTPERIEPETYAGPAVAPAVLTLVRDDRPRPATALLCTLAELVPWLELATDPQLDGLRAAWCPPRQVLVMGDRLPPLAAGTRFWGRLVLVPLGLCPDPEVSEKALAEVLGMGASDIALWTDSRVEVISDSVMGPLTRAGLRLATRGQPGGG